MLAGLYVFNCREDVTYCNKVLMKMCCDELNQWIYIQEQIKKGNI